jgi:predicted TIM-barrel fold metal-dependent hydrolase
LARTDAGGDLAAYVDGIKAIDTHAHPLRFVAAGAAADSEFDALPLDGLPAFPVPLGLRGDHPWWREAQHALYGTPGPGEAASADTGAVHHRAVEEARGRVMQERGAQFPAWALDQAGIDVMFANRIVMGAGLEAPRFRWIAFADALMLPLDTRTEASRTPDTRALYPLEAKLLRRYLSDLHLMSIPPTLDAYERDVVAATLTRQQAAGAIGIKFEAAYLRSLDFEPADAAAARGIYTRYATGGVPTHTEYTTLEDYLFRVIAREAGRLGLTVQIHATDAAGGYYGATGSAPHLLESAFNDTTLRRTTFVLVHGGWPRVEETLSMLGKPNVYADISLMNVIAEPAALASALRLWLGAYPEKVLFGTDAFDGGAEQGWEQVAWVASRSARRALVSALGGMVRDGDITTDRAKHLARMVLRENAMTAYHMGSTGGR